METTLNANLFQWLAMVELPVLGGMFWFVWRTRRDGELALADHYRRFEINLGRLRENVDAYKLVVANTYVSIPYLKDVERRLTSHLVRIENKLDRRSENRAEIRPENREAQS